MIKGLEKAIACCKCNGLFRHRRTYADEIVIKFAAPEVLFLMRRCGTAFTLLILTFSNTHAQPLFSKPSVAARFFWGSFVTHLPKAAYLRDSYSYFGELSVQQQTDGRYDWQRSNGLPQLGVALQYGNSGSKQYIGRMMGVFPFMNWKLYNSRDFTSGFRAGVGLGWVQKPYDVITNHKNILLGTHTNAYINFLWENDVRLFSNLHIGAGLSFTHLSNGSSTLPNLGLNIPAVSLGLRYGLDRPTVIAQVKGEVSIRPSRWVFFTTVGFKQAPWVGGKRYITNSLKAEWNRPLWRSGHYSAGAVLFYNPALVIDPAGILDHTQNGVIHKVQAGAFVGYEHLLGRLSIPLQLGVYVYNHNSYPTIFQELGLRYRINQRWSTELAMKAHMGRADFIHAGLGYHIK